MTLGEQDRGRAAGFPRNRFSSSGWLTPLLVFLLCAGLVIGSYAHTLGRFHKLREVVATEAAPPQQTLGPGGQDPLRITRTMSGHGTAPEFLSATLLPGRGFNLWQLTATVPGRGEVALLAAPSVDQAALLLTGADDDANGAASTSAGGAFLAPWAAHLAGTPATGSDLLHALWHGQRINFPSQSTGSTQSTEGLLLKRGADQSKTYPLPDGQGAQAMFHAGSFSDSWPSTTELTVQVELSAQTVILTMTAQNTGNTPEPIGLGWRPMFAIASGNRANALLVVPSTTRAEVPDRKTGLPSGKMVSTQGTPFDFSSAAGTRLGEASLDDTYLDLHAALMADGPIAELRDPESGYGLRIVPLSRNITNFHVEAPAGKPWVAIEPNMNVNDPLGAEWEKLENPGLITLAPGDRVEWKVRLEIFAVSAAGKR